jgi:serine/threonine protein kinase
MSDNTSRIDNSTARIDATMRIDTQGLNAAGEVFDIGKTIVLNGKICTIQSLLNQISGEALVYKVSIDGKPYALKHYRIDRPLSDTAYNALSRIKVHPKNRIIRIYDFGKYNGQDFEIMEFAEGGTLSAYLKNSGAVQNIQQLKNIVTQIHEGLQRLHGEYRIIYQDLKPENIYFRDAAKTAIVLGDFGISSVMEDDDDEAEVIANLTDLYAAPELARKGDRREVVVTPAVDYFALGITMFELWLGEEPFNGMKPAKRDHIIRNKEVILPPDMNEDCKTLIQGLLDPMPKTRWGNQHVQKWLDGDRLSVGVTRSYDQVMALYNAGRFDEALPLFQTLAEQGSARAQNKMGECYYNANGVGYDEKKALEWFLKAAKRGNADAFANLGECYELGNGVRQNLETAAKWYRKAAKQGNTDAQTRYDKIMSKRNSAKESSSSSYSGRPHYNDYDSYDSHDSGGRAGMFFLTFLAILPKLIRFIIIPLIVMFFIFSFVKYLKKIPDTLFGALDSTFEQILGTEDVTGSSGAVGTVAQTTNSGQSVTISADSSGGIVEWARGRYPDNVVLNANSITNGRDINITEVRTDVQSPLSGHPNLKWAYIYVGGKKYGVIWDRTTYARSAHNGIELGMGSEARSAFDFYSGSDKDSIFADIAREAPSIKVVKP